MLVCAVSGVYCFLFSMVMRQSLLNRPVVVLSAQVHSGLVVNASVRSNVTSVIAVFITIGGSGCLLQALLLSLLDALLCGCRMF